MTDDQLKADIPALVERLRKLQHRFLNEVEGEYVANQIGQAIHTVEVLREELATAERRYSNAMDDYPFRSA